jgi:ubiquinone/menaquinone biosynthesis C-methylase UbiE
LKNNSDFLEHYVSMAPLALAFERTMECRILSRMPFDRPVLDLGCGEGLFAKILFAEKIDTGIDPNTRELERARRLDTYIELINCRGDSIPKPDASYRTILSNSVLEHIPDLPPVLREAHRLLSPGGRLYLTVPSDRFDEYTWISEALGLLGLFKLQQRFRAFYCRFWIHYHFYAPERWAKIVESCGFEILELHTYAPMRVCLMDDLLVPFSLPAFVTKRVCNRWSLLQGLRRILLAPNVAFGRAMLEGAERCDDGGLVFLAARKS